jgi:hypothetical protein
MASSGVPDLIPSTVDARDNSSRAAIMRRGWRQRWDEALYQSMQQQHRPATGRGDSQQLAAPSATAAAKPGERAAPAAAVHRAEGKGSADELVRDRPAVAFGVRQPAAALVAGDQGLPMVGPRAVAPLLAAPARLGAAGTVPRPLPAAAVRLEMPGPVHVAVRMDGESAHVRIRDYTLAGPQQHQSLLRKLRKWLARAGLGLGSVLLNGVYVLANPEQAPVNKESGSDRSELDRRL